MRDLRLFDQYHTMPTAGGLDDQPAARLAGMEMARQIREILRKMQGDDWAQHITDDERRLMEIMYGE